MHSKGEAQINSDVSVLPHLCLSTKDVVASLGLITMTTLPWGPMSIM